MEFISKMLRICFTGVFIICPVPISETCFKFSTIPTFQSFKASSFKKNEHPNNKRSSTQTFQHSQNFRFSDMKNNSFQGCSHICLYLLKYFGDKYGPRGSRFSRFVGSSRDHPKSIAIRLEVKISNSGMIETP